MAANAREAARLGRVEQLKTLEAFERGETVTFKVHNKPSGYKLAKADVKSPPKKAGKVAFPDEVLLHDHVTNGDLAKVNEMLDAGVDVNAVDPDGMTPLHRACIENYLNIASALVTRGASVTREDNDWWTPLHAAASGGNWRICNLLFNNGADPLAVNAEGDLPLDLVADAKVEGIIQKEMEAKGIKTDEEVEEERKKRGKMMLADMKKAAVSGVDLNKQYQFGATYLHVAAVCGYTQVVQHLLEQPKVNPNIRDVDGNSPLHLAVFFQQYECVMYLVAKGADLKLRNKLRQKPIVLSEDQTMIRLLTALEKKTEQARAARPAAAAPGGGDGAAAASAAKGPRRYAGSISRSSRAAKGGVSRKDRQGEASKHFQSS
eukprot:CAMPEP_0182915798 /NCGR_PEP_ID=MMETSP0105_2-20130417/546_1 /TAXON_ID=81532 ORGANISM="Acanthoeca-like sp., Strain 10tr" /NCGR_SAMPLE_ID=MMETSP0105_2 /ASSEMBLY_ACC=CAM_ASM_000205 /LENGTH=375 /DNA_ID=CAMNT_0025052689 /DNA_START=278 /DNA_END=1405 /DNA_ORIENTATION=+